MVGFASFLLPLSYLLLSGCKKHFEQHVKKCILQIKTYHAFKSMASTRQAIKLTKDLMEVCSQGGFTLTKWVSNNHKVLTTVPEGHRAKVVAQLDLDKEKPPLERVLGI